MSVSKVLRRVGLAATTAAVCVAGTVVSAAPAQAADWKNVMLTSVPAGTGSVELFWYDSSGYPHYISCWAVQSGRDTSTGYYLLRDQRVLVRSFGDSSCDTSVRAWANRTMTGNYSNWWVDVP
ncbi:hypothetical protein ABZ078_05740 [Streptomyces sp. NPDC006385]|uniref:hypothetical protein n=1 Tax=Streptomyces sp. NPDC006385 TaxID=3156761 RepID=UPI0033BA7908